MGCINSTPYYETPDPSKLFPSDGEDGFVDYALVPDMSSFSSRVGVFRCDTRTQAYSSGTPLNQPEYVFTCSILGTYKLDYAEPIKAKAHGRLVQIRPGMHYGTATNGNGTFTEKWAVTKKVAGGLDLKVCVEKKRIFAGDGKQRREFALGGGWAAEENEMIVALRKDGQVVARLYEPDTNVKSTYEYETPSGLRLLESLREDEIVMVVALAALLSPCLLLVHETGAGGGGDYSYDEEGYNGGGDYGGGACGGGDCGGGEE